MDRDYHRIFLRVEILIANDEDSSRSVRRYGYSHRYFERFEAAGPTEINLPNPEALATFEDPALDRPDAVLHLASDRPEAVLEAEVAIWGDRDEANGVTVDSTFEAVFELAGGEGSTSRRTGFVGVGLPAEHREADGIPDDAPVDENAPLFMNFKSGFKKNQASEERVTIDAGPFAGGTTQHISKLRLDLDQWYNQDTRYQRVGKMFCPVHAEEELVDGPGDNLGDDGAIEGRCIDDIDEHPGRYGMLGHSQKMAADARRDGEPLILRRDFDSTDDGRAGLHFVSLQSGIEDFVTTRRAMNGSRHVEAGGIGQRINNGILQYLTVERRGNFLIPPRSLRSLPPADP